MAVRLYCDRCDKLLAGEVDTLTAHMQGEDLKHFHLCKPCLAKVLDVLHRAGKEVARGDV